MNEMVFMASGEEKQMETTAEKNERPESAWT
jgi:hypothetical protein